MIKKEVKIADLIDETIFNMGNQRHIQMTNEEKAYLNAHFEPFEINKGKLILTKGEEINYLYYLEKGHIRLWFPDKKQREITAQFIKSKEFVNFFLSHEKHHAYYHAKAFTTCKLWKLSKTNLLYLYDHSINFNKLARAHMEKGIIHKIRREEKFHTLNAQERYQLLLETEKWLLQIMPLKDIASYLGITPQALSHIRRKI